MIDDEDFLNDFLVEGKEHIEALYEILSKDRLERDDLAQVFRTFHSLKGLAGMLGLEETQKFCHCIEDRLNEIREKNSSLQCAVSWLKIATHELSEIVEYIEKNGVERPTDESIEKSEKSWEQIELTEIDCLESDNDDKEKSTFVKAGATIRVPEETIQHLLGVAGELLVSKNSLEHHCKELRAKIGKDMAPLEKIRNDLNRLVEDLQYKLMVTNMVPCRGLFNRIDRIFHDILGRVQKEVNIEFSGHDVLLEKAALENLVDPLMHIVRNAVDHGIESVEKREELGKPSFGKVSVKVFNHQGQIIIEVKDDGGGLDAEKILAKAIQKEIVSSDDSLSDSSILNLIFEPGFSTASEVTEISGRGVGMDVVKSNIEKLHGKIDVNSEIGLGTKFHICIPQATSVKKCLLVDTEKAPLAIPVDLVLESIRLSEEQLMVSGRGIVFGYRENVVYWCNIFSISKNSRYHVLLFSHERKMYGVPVKRILGVSDLVIRPTPLFVSDRSFIGGSVLGSGEAILIQDPRLKFREAA